MFWNSLFLFQIVLMVSFSSRTTSMDIQRNLEANVEKRTKDTYGPPMGKRLLVFMDDMNMPKVGEAEGVGRGQWRGRVVGLADGKASVFILHNICRARLWRVSLGDHATGGTLSLDLFLCFSKD